MKKAQSIIELLVVMTLLAILLPVITVGFVSTNNGKAQQTQRFQATGLLKEAEEAVRSVREKGWTQFAVDGTYHPAISSSAWSLSSNAETVLTDFTRSIIISDVYRDATGAITSVGGTIDPSTKKVTLSVSWSLPTASSIQSTMYVTRYLNNASIIQTTNTDFNAGLLGNVQVTNNAGGEVALANNNLAKWCSPSLSTATIDLPDGPPVAVAATASAVTTTIPNDVFVAVAPTDATSVKLAYVNVSANTAPPVPTLIGTFTLDPTKYSSPGLVPSGINLDNSFRTNDVKYYISSGGNLYGLIATDKPDHEVIAVQIKSAGNNSYKDSINKIYKYWTFFNTRQYQGDARSTPNQDQTPFGYGAVALTVLNNRGYIASGGYLYVFDLSNIDSKTPSNGLDMVGCRIELDGYDCQPNNGTDMKYNAGQTGATWGNTTPPAHLDCSDGGNIELYADHQLSAVQVAGSTYVYVAVGAGTNPELDIVNATTVPTASTNPKINSNNCGTLSSGSSSWKTGGSLDFDPYSGTEEAANSVYAKSDGTRAYMSSNGGIMHNNIPDSNQFYIIDTTSKTSPKFLSTWASTKLTPLPGHYLNTASSGYYNGDATNIELYPRRSLTVLNGQRAILVGQDGIPADGTEPQEYQVLNISTEATPAYCGGINFISGFNDLTSVSEADGDNFVYMVANTTEKQLKIIQGGPDNAVYSNLGTFQSSIFSPSGQAAFNRFQATVSQPANTTISMQVGVANQVGGVCPALNSFTYYGPDAANPTTSYFTQTAGVISGSVPLASSAPYNNPGQCYSFKAKLETTDQTQTPQLMDVTTSYSP